MCAIKVHHKVLPNMILDLPLNKRSISQRIKTSEKLCDGFMMMLKEIPEGSLSIKKYKEMIYSLIPNKPEILVSQVNMDKCKGSCNVLFSAEQTGNDVYEMFYKAYKVNFDLEDDLIKTEHITIVHETRHLFDRMCLPKINIKRNIENADNAIEFDMISYTRNNIVSPTGLISKSDLKCIDKYSKINLLQDVRHTLEEELRAYNQELRWCNLLTKSWIKRLDNKCVFNTQFIPDLGFKSKLKIITQQLKKEFKKK